MLNTTVTLGFHGGSTGNDVLHGIAQSGAGQIHTYGRAGDDHLILDFDNDNYLSAPDAHSFGHHVRGDGGSIPSDDSATDRGNDTFEFTNTANVQAGATMVGRIDDFDSSRDTIIVEGQELDLAQMGEVGLPSGGSVRIVEFNGAHNDPGALPQQWILITTASGGHIFYALEGARVDMYGDDGRGTGHAQEHHFVQYDDLPMTNGQVDFDLLPTVQYVDPINYVPAGYDVQGGIIINDDDNTGTDAFEFVSGTSGGDLIAAGLNDDEVYGRAGDDHIWGGSGNDTLFGGNGDDILQDAHGNNVMTGGAGADTFIVNPSSTTAGTTTTITDFVYGTDTLIVDGVEVDLLSEDLDFALVIQGDSGNWELHNGGTGDVIILEGGIGLPAENTAPTAAAHTATIGENAATYWSENVLIDLASDADGDALRVVEVNGSPDNLTTWIEGSDGGAFIIRPNGYVNFATGGDFDYLVEGEVATTSITYTISDGNGGTVEQTSTFTVTGTNDAPTASAHTATIGENGATYWSENVLIDLAHDAEGDTLRVVEVNGSADNLTTWIEGSDGGAFVIRPNGYVNFATGGDFDYLAEGETATTSITYTISDGNGGTVEQTSTFTVTGTGGAAASSDTNRDVFVFEEHSDMGVSPDMFDLTTLGVIETLAATDHPIDPYVAHQSDASAMSDEAITAPSDDFIF